MRSSYKLVLVCFILLCPAAFLFGQAQEAAREQDEVISRTMRPVIRGRLYAATSMKQEATRAKRMATAIEWMTQGKSRHWKYQK